LKIPRNGTEFINNTVTVLVFQFTSIFGLWLIFHLHPNCYAWWQTRVCPVHIVEWQWISPVTFLSLVWYCISLPCQLHRKLKYHC